MKDDPKNKDTNTKEIFAAIPAITGKIKPIAKTEKNREQGYMFRSVDDVYIVLQPLLAEYGVTIVPEIISSEETQSTTRSGRVMWRVVLLVGYTLFAKDGSFIKSSIRAEAMDTSDKASYKALSMAFKYLCFQVFCIPIEGEKDVEHQNHEAIAQPQPASPTETAQAPSPEEVRADLVKKLIRAVPVGPASLVAYFREGMRNKNGEAIAWLGMEEELEHLTETRLKWAIKNGGTLKNKIDQWIKEQNAE